MKIIRTLMVSLMLAIGSTAQADNYQYLTITQDGGDTSFSVSNIQKITFDTTDMILQLKDGTTQSLPLSGLQKMFFANGTNAIANMSEAKSTIQFKGGMLHADLVGGERLTIYNMKGEQVLSASQSGTYDLTTFVKGVYIIKVGAEARKVVNK